MSNNLEALAHRRWQCACGREHSTEIARIVVSPAALDSLADLIIGQDRFNGGRKLKPDTDRILIIADGNTARVGMEPVERCIRPLGFSIDTCVLSGTPDLIPDERAVFTILNAMRPETALLIAIGSGTINDLTRFISSRTGTPYYILATAPSMDGYASTVAPLIHNHMKITYEACGAAAIIADSRWLADSPAIMRSAGLGDLLGKYSAICDWYLGSIAEDEYWCPEVAEQVLKTVNRIVERSDAIAARDPDAVQMIMEGLVMTGIAMSHAGNSRPASGSEHHLSHFWEMRFLRDNRKAVLHGSKVGLATILTSALYHHLLTITPDFAKARRRLEQVGSDAFDQWVTQMQESYAAGADEIIELEKKAGKNLPAQAIQRLEKLEQSWDTVCRFVRNHMPPCETVRSALVRTGGAADPDALGIKPEEVLEAVRYAKELRNRYSILQLYWDLGIMKEAEAVAYAVFPSEKIT